jgi:SAM-dependent methyltransferase
MEGYFLDMIVQTWKLAPILTGTLTWLPLLNTLRQQNASTGGTNSARYCYSVWLRHLVSLTHVFNIKGARIAELGPGDSIGVGLAALLSGAESYVALDRVPFSAKSNLELMLENLIEMYCRKEAIPDNIEFPNLRPQLTTYDFPDHAVDWSGFGCRAERIRAELKKDLKDGRVVRYRAPWTSFEDIEEYSLDLFFSQAVLEYCAPLEPAYEAMSRWLKPGGYASHRISFAATYLSPFWNGHWAYTDWEWYLARGRREYFLNREPLSVHLAYSNKFGFETILLKADSHHMGLPVHTLASRFRSLDPEDLRTSGAYIIFRKRRTES